MNEWINCTDRLPKPEEDVVLVHLDGYGAKCRHGAVDTDRFDGSKWIRWGGHVTHWMSLPKQADMNRPPVKPCPVDRGKLIVGIGCHINDEDRCGECPYIPKDDNDPCIKNLCMDALAYIGYLEEVANEKIH